MPFLPAKQHNYLDPFCRCAACAFASRHMLGWFRSLWSRLPCLGREHILSEPYATAWPRWTQRICLRCGSVYDYAPLGTQMPYVEGVFNAHPDALCEGACCAELRDHHLIEVSPCL